MFWKIDYRNATLNALDAIRMYDEERRDNAMSGYTIEDIKDLAKYREKINKRMDDLEKYGIDWYDAYKLKKWTKEMHKIMDRAHLRNCV